MTPRSPWRTLTALGALFSLAGLPAHAGPEAPPEPALCFDATRGDTFELRDGKVVVWRDREGRGELRAPDERARPQRAGNSVRFDGRDDLLRLASRTPVHLGQVHVFVVGRLRQTRAGQYFLGNVPAARFDLGTSPTQFEIELGNEPNTRRHGFKLDRERHLFELSLTRSDPLGDLRHGEFRIDGHGVGGTGSRASAALDGSLVVGARDAGRGGFLEGEIAEIAVYTRELNAREQAAVRAQLAKKWALTLATEPVDAGPGPREVPVTPPGVYSSLGIYNESPESPDGSQLAYIRFEAPPHMADRAVVPFSIWLCDRDLGHQRWLLDSPVTANNHNGAFLQWVDDQRIAFCGGHLAKLPNGTKADRAIYVIDARTGATLYGPYTDGFLGDSTVKGRMLMCIDGDASNVGPRGIYELDTATGKVRPVVIASTLAGYARGFSWPGYRPDPKRWQPTHANYSPQGTRLSFEFNVGGSMYMLFTSRPDGSELKYWGTDKPLHEHWFDEDTLCGADSITDDGEPDDRSFRRWNLDRQVVETLAGPVTHTALSSDHAWYAGETPYWSDPVSLFVYRRGERRPAAVVFSAPAGVVWDEQGHVNPSFSRDGKRLYYNRPVGPDLKQVYFIDLTEIPASSPPPKSPGL